MIATIQHVSQQAVTFCCDTGVCTFIKLSKASHAMVISLFKVYLQPALLVRGMCHVTSSHAYAAEKSTDLLSDSKADSHTGLLYSKIRRLIVGRH